MRINNEFSESQDLSTEMEGIAKTRFLPLLGRESLHWFEIEVIIKMEVVEVLAMDQQIQHIVTLTTHL